jgi:hypothetical protein
MKKTHAHKRLTALVTLLCFFFSYLPAYTHATQTIAPNLMVIFGNSYSMNRYLDDVTLPTVTNPPHFNDTSGGGVGTYFAYPLYGDDKNSKLYVAKQSLNTVLSSTASDKINIGFATFRQTFGMEAAATLHYTRGTWPLLEANDTTMLTGGKTTQEKTDYGNIATNFKATEWYRIWLNSLGRSAKLGKGLYDYNKGVVDDTPSKTKYITGINNGIPSQIIYKPIGTQAWSIINASNLSPSATATTIHDLTYTTSSYGAQTVFNGTGATGEHNFLFNTPDLNVASASNPLVIWKLCYPYYNSQNNTFNAFYLADKDVVDSYPTSSSTYTLNYSAWDYAKFDSTGWAIGQSNTITCPGDGTVGGSFSGTYQEKSQRIANTYKSDGSRVWFSAIAHYYAGTSSSTLALGNGVLSGWSGETTYVETAWPATTGTTTAVYPSGVANPNRADRQMITKGWQQTDATKLVPAKQNHMGVFLDLPTPSLGYVDQRATVKGFMGLTQMSQSGLDYDPASQTIAGGKGITASTMDSAYNSQQSPIYDSLLGALAYYKEYIKADSFRKCRSNNILLFFDGKEDAHWVNNSGTTQYMKPADIAAQLLAIGVKTHVVILSNNTGDVVAADAIAAAGGTTTAYKATSAASLLNSFTAIFSGLSGPAKTTAAPAMPPQLATTGSKLYQANYTLSPVAGHLSAYGVNSSGYIAKTALWDAADPNDSGIPVTGRMTALNRTNKLLSNSATGAIVAFNALDAVAFAASTSPTVADIINYTIDPSYGSGIYLAGRASGSFMGMYGDQTMMPLLLTTPSNATLDSFDANFTTYKNAQVNRKSSVLVHNDDGFLYAFDADNGSLLWGWIPRQLVANLKNFSTFWSAGNMKGGSVIADAPTTGTNYASFVLGVAQGGALHYALMLKNDTNVPPNVYPDTVAWTNSVPGATSPSEQAPVVSYIKTAGVNAGYANYIKTSGATSTLYVHKIATGAIASQVVLPFTPSSDLVYVSPSSSALNNGFFYVADTTGAVWKMPVDTNAATVIAGRIKVGNTYNNVPATYVGTYAYNKVDYVWATNATGMTVFGYNATTSAWQNLWESHVGGAGNWDATGVTYTADTSAVITPTVGKIQMLPTGASITARASAVKDMLLLPVLVPDASEPCAAGIAYLFEYAIGTGNKPNTVVYSINADGTRTENTGNLKIGLGAAMSPVLSKISWGTVIAASANQDLSGNTGSSSFGVLGSKSGIVSWREIAN